MDVARKKDVFCIETFSHPPNNYNERFVLDVLCIFAYHVNTMHFYISCKDINLCSIVIITIFVKSLLCLKSVLVHTCIVHSRGIICMRYYRYM